MTGEKLGFSSARDGLSVIRLTTTGALVFPGGLRNEFARAAGPLCSIALFKEKRVQGTPSFPSIWKDGKVGNDSAFSSAFATSITEPARAGAPVQETQYLTVERAI